MNRDDIVLFLKKHKELLKQDFFVEEISLFGSAARNELTASSDIDFMIEVKKQNKSFLRLLKLKNFLETSLNRNVDLVFTDSVNPVIRYCSSQELIHV